MAQSNRAVRGASLKHGARLNRLRKNSIGAPVLKGRGFTPRRKYSKIIRGFSR